MNVLFVRKVFVFLIVLNYIYSFAFCEKQNSDIPYGATLSKITESLLKRNSFSATKENLRATGEDEFPFNIISDFPGNEKHERDIKIQNQKKTTVLFDITQEDFYVYQKEITDLMNHVNKKKYPFSVIFLFTALDENDIFSDSAFAGTEAWLKNTEESEYVVAIIISFKKSEGASEILTGGKSKITPLWLVRALEKSFREEKIPIKIPHFFHSLYRTELLRGDEKSEIFFASSIPCAKIRLKNTDSFSAIKNFLDNYKIENTENWDNHYVFFKPTNKTGAIWISEQNVFLLLEIFSILSVLIICAFSFTGMHRARYINDFRKSWFMVLLTIVISFLSLIFAQFCCLKIPFIKNSNPVIQFGSKIMISMLLISILFALQAYIKIPVTPFIYGYTISIITIANIFIFSAIDIIFFILFGIEYFIVYATKSSKTLKSLVIAMILMLIPFAPYAFTVIKRATDQSMRAFVFSTPSFNLLLTLALFPFQIMWLKILTSLNIFSSNVLFSVKRFVMNTFFSMCAVTLLITAGLLIITIFIYNGGKSPAPQIHTVDSQKKNISISHSFDDFLGMTTHHITILSEKPALRYEITLSSDSVPVYDSTYEYSISENSKTARFSLPDYPPLKITIDYIAQSDRPATLNINAFYKTADEAKIERETFSAQIIAPADPDEAIGVLDDESEGLCPTRFFAARPESAGYAPTRFFAACLESAGSSSTSLFARSPGSAGSSPMSPFARSFGSAGYCPTMPFARSLESAGYCPTLPFARSFGSGGLCPTRVLAARRGSADCCPTRFFAGRRGAAGYAPLPLFVSGAFVSRSSVIGGEGAL